MPSEPARAGQSRKAGDRCRDRGRRAVTGAGGTRDRVVLDPRLDVPYQELISMAGAHSGRAEGAEKAELQRLIERLARALSEQIRGEELLELMALPAPRKVCLRQACVELQFSSAIRAGQEPARAGHR